MGLKRHFESEDFLMPQKHLKQVECVKTDNPEGDNYLLFNSCPPHEEMENELVFDIPFFDGDVGTSGTSSLVTQSVSEGDAESEAVGHFEDVSSSLDCSPERIVPIGPNFQARLPPCIGSVESSHLDSDINCKDDREEKYMGTCIIPMPDENAYELDEDVIGVGRADCNCMDKGSRRCVRQHIAESLEELRSYLDDEQFVLLGLADSGEDVTCDWNEEEEELFSEVVFSNPVSAGKNFWRHLSAAFPARTKMELVSYYFNVFILRKRATQNRCKFLDVDSDDDEWHGDTYEVPREAEVFPKSSVGGQQAEYVDSFSEQHEDGYVDNDKDGMLQYCMQEIFAFSSFSENKFVDWEERTDVVGNFFELQDDSLTSFDCLLNSPTDTSSPVAAAQPKEISAQFCGKKDCTKEAYDAKATRCQEAKEFDK